MKKKIYNLLSLFSIQGSNAILPIIVFPYVLSKLGDVLYSQIVISEAIMFIIYAIVLYSFEIDGVSRAIKYNDENLKNKLSRLFTHVLLIRLIIFSVCISILFIFSFFMPKDYFVLLLLWLMFPLSFIFQNSYFYIGTENNTPLAIIILTFRILCVCLIFYFVDINSPAYIVPLTIGGTYLSGGLLSFLYLIFTKKIKITRISFSYLKKLIIDGKEIFLGNISILMFKDLNVIVIGLFTFNPSAISAYSIAEKIIKSIQATTRPLNQFYFPIAVRLIQSTKRPNIESFKKIFSVTLIQLLVLFLIFCAINLVMIFFSDDLIFIKSYNNFDLVTNLCLIMIVSVFFGVSNFMFGSVGLNNLGEKKYMASSIFITGILTIVMLFILVNLMNVYGASISFVLSEVILFSLISYKYFKKKVNNGYRLS